MDEIDRKILRALQANPQASLQELGEIVGLSHTPCWRRVKRLEADGVIQERAVILNAKALDLGVTVYAGIKLKNHAEETLDDLERSAQGLPEVVECYSMSGENDYIMKIVIESIDRYETFLKKTLLHLPGVSSINSSFALKCVKMTTRLPI